MSHTTKGLVLIADAESSIRDFLHFYLKRAGYQVLQAGDGHDVLIEMAKVQPDLVLADLSLPGIRGDHLCKIIKKNPDTRDMYIILMTPTNDMLDNETTIEALNIGADDTIIKPLRGQELIARVDSAFRIIRMQKEIKQHNRELTVYRENVQRDIELAARLQLSLLPEAGAVGPYRYTHIYKPVGGIGGDIYAISPLPYGGVGVLIADVSGHGVTASLISTMVKTSFENHIRTRGGPLIWAQCMNRDLARNTLEEQYATAFIAQLDPMTSTISYVCAGHEPAIYIADGQSGEPRHPAILNNASSPLGMDENMSFSERTTPFAPGDRLILYTDGLVEAESNSNTILSSEGLLRFCSEMPSELEDAAALIFDQTQLFIDPNKFTDDVTLVVIDHL
ncbi:MAG: fused response regulator/phosphatase [Holophagales bacterium]|jgi:sigma-B regulation protein RsbU (phosphoserine phosphatase)|nr:fused response regulator/phosphatase [Holophagales bacterium]